MGLISSTSEMTMQAKQAAMLALIMEQTADSQGQAGREADGASGSIKEFTTEVKNLTAAMGEELLPMITPILKKLTEFMEWFGNLDKGTKKTIVNIALLVAAIAPVAKVVSVVSGGISTLTGTILPGLDKMLDKLAGVGMPKASNAAGKLSNTTSTLGKSAGQASTNTKSLGKNVDEAGTSAQKANMKFLSVAAGIAVIAVGVAVLMLSISQLHGG